MYRTLGIRNCVKISCNVPIKHIVHLIEILANQLGLGLFWLGLGPFGIGHGLLWLLEPLFQYFKRFEEAVTQMSCIPVKGTVWENPKILFTLS